MSFENKLGLEIGTILDTKNAEKTLKDLDAKIIKTRDYKINVQIGNDIIKAVKTINTLKDAYGNLYEQVKLVNRETGAPILVGQGGNQITKVTEAVEGIKTLTTETHKWANTKGEVNNWTTSVDNAGKTIQTRTKQYVTDTNELVTETNKWGRNAQGQWTQLSDTIKTTTDIIKENTTSTSTVRGQIEDLGKTYDGLITTTEKVGSNGEYLRTVISKYTNELGQAVVKTEQFNKANQQVATTMRKIGDIPKVQDTGKTTLINKDGLKVVTEYANGVATLRTETNQYKTALGALITETKVYDEQTHKLIKSHREELNNQKEILDAIEKEKQLKQQLTTTTREKEAIVQREGKTYQAIVKTIQEETHEYGTLTTTIITYKNALGETVVETQKLNDKGEAVAQTTRTVNKELKNTGESAEKANYGVKNLGWSLGDAISRLSNFYLASLPIRAVQTAITDTISTIKEFDSALIEFRKVSDLAGASLTKYVAKLAEMGELTGSTMQAMVEASTEFRKSGFSDEDSAKLASVAEMYRNIADEEISAGESASFIIAQMKAFNIEADQAEHIIDAVNEVANNFSVSSADLAKNLGNMSAIMAINNVSMEEQIGMLTGVTEITRKAGSASRGLVMISSRLTQVLDETSSTGKKLTKIYNELGIALTDENGQLRGHYDILGDLAEKWDSLSENQQKYIALTSAGARQQQNFVALMENWGQVVKATVTAENSLGSAQKENAKVMDSVAKKVEILKSQFQQLVIGDGGLQKVAKLILDIGIALLKFANSDIGQAVLGMTALTLSVYGFSKAINSGIGFLQTIVKEFITYALEAGIATTATEAYNIAIERLTIAIKKNAKAMLTSPLFVAGLMIAGVAAVCAVIDYFVITLDEAKEKLNDLNEAIDTSENNLKTYKDSLSDVKTELEKLDKKSLKITNKEEAEELNKQRNELENISSELERQIKLEEIKLAQEKELAEREAVRVLNTEAYHKGIGAGHELTTDTQALDIAADRYRSLRDELDNLEKKQIEVAESKGVDSRAYKNLEEDIDNTKEKISDLITKGNELATSLSESAENLTDKNKELKDSTIEQIDEWTRLIGESEELSESINEIQDNEEELENTTEDITKEIEGLADSLGITATELEKLNEIFDEESLGKYLTELADVRQEISDTNTVVDNLQEALENASAALAEYNENGYLTLDTFQGLMAINAQYLAALVNEEGQLEINQTTLGNLVETIKIAKIEELAQAAALEINALQTENVSNAASNATPNIDAVGNAAVEAGRKASEGAVGLATFNNELDRMTGKSTYTRQEQAIIDKYKKIAQDISNIKVNTTAAGNAATKAGKKGSSAAKSAKDATKELNKELEETKKNYETVIKWINKQYDKKTDSIKKAKDEATKAIEKEIKTLEKEKDTILDNIEKEINALEKEKDARQKYWDDQIDALKKANQEQKDALELQEKLDALEKARNTKVKIYKEGQGFVYDIDQTAVAEAQKALDEYLSEKAYEDELARLEALKDAEMDNYEKRLDSLNEYKDGVQASYEEQIDNLNAHKDALEEQYDAEIELWENYKQQFEDMVNAYQEQQDKLLAEQLLGTKLEGDNWMTRLDNLAEFVRKYNELQKQLDTGNTNVSNTATMKSGGGTVSSGTKSTATTGSYDREMALSHQGYHGMPTNVVTGTRATSGLNQYIPYSGTTNVSSNGVIKKVSSHASGISSISDNELAIVGENPNQEIVIGSKLNNGALMSLNKGAGVVNAESSSTLAGMLNQVSKFGSSGFGSGNGTLNNNINNDSLTINGVTIQGANINDPQTFVNGLLSLKAEAIQRAYRHR